VADDRGVPEEADATSSSGLSLLPTRFRRQQPGFPLPVIEDVDGGPKCVQVVHRWFDRLLLPVPVESVGVDGRGSAASRTFSAAEIWV